MFSENVMGFTVFDADLDLILLDRQKTLMLNTISPNSYGLSTWDLDFKSALKNSDILVLDGVYFALASILLKYKNIKKNQGPEVFYHFMSRLNNRNGKVFFLGSSIETLEKIKLRSRKDFPNIDVYTYSPPFKDDFTVDESRHMCDIINEVQPDILFIGMTCPKQEKWAHKNKSYIDVSLICGIGAVFDWYAGNYKEIRPIWWKLRLGWLIRAIQRPELLSRNVPNYYIFFKDLLLTFFRFKKF